MKKILILNLAFYPKIGGVENSLRSLCEIYLSRGDEVTVVTADIVDETKKSYPVEDKMFGAKIIRFRKNHPLTYFYSCFKKLRELKESFEFDLVISRSHVTTYLAYYAGFRSVNYVVPGVVKNQCSMTFSTVKGVKAYFKLKINEYIQKKSFSLAERNFVFSETMYAQVCDVFPSCQILKTYPGCDENRFYADTNEKVSLRAKYGFDQDAKLLLCVGRLNKVKGFSYAINGLKKLPDDFHLVIVGEGPEYESLHQLCCNLSIESRVSFVKKVLEPELFYRMADAFLFTSLYEPFGQVLLEATFSELKVYAFDPKEDGSVDTATVQIYSGYKSLVNFVSNKEFLANEIESSFESFNLNKLELKSFKEKYSWRRLVDTLDKHNTDNVKGR